MTNRFTALPSRHPAERVRARAARLGRLHAGGVGAGAHGAHAGAGERAGRARRCVEHGLRRARGGRESEARARARAHVHGMASEGAVGAAVPTGPVAPQPVLEAG